MRQTKGLQREATLVHSIRILLSVVATNQNLLNRLGQQLLVLVLHKLRSVVKPLNSHAQQLFQPCLRFQLLPALDLHFQHLLVGSRCAIPESILYPPSPCHSRDWKIQEGRLFNPLPPPLKKLNEGVKLNIEISRWIWEGVFEENPLCGGRRREGEGGANSGLKHWTKNSSEQLITFIYNFYFTTAVQKY